MPIRSKRSKRARAAAKPANLLGDARLEISSCARELRELSRRVQTLGRALIRASKTAPAIGQDPDDGSSYTVEGWYGGLLLDRESKDLAELARQLGELGRERWENEARAGVRSLLLDAEKIERLNRDKRHAEADAHALAALADASPGFYSGDGPAIAEFLSALRARGCRWSPLETLATVRPEAARTLADRFALTR